MSCLCCACLHFDPPPLLTSSHPALEQGVVAGLNGLAWSPSSFPILNKPVDRPGTIGIRLHLKHRNHRLHFGGASLTCKSQSPALFRLFSFSFSSFPVTNPVTNQGVLRLPILGPVLEFLIWTGLLNCEYRVLWLLWLRHIPGSVLVLISRTP